MPLGQLSPIELLQQITVNEKITVDSVINIFVRLAEKGAIPDSQTEFLLNKTGYQLLKLNRKKEAVKLFGLQTMLFPEVANGFDSLGEAYLAMGDRKNAEIALLQAIAINPGFKHAKEMLEK